MSDKIQDVYQKEDGLFKVPSETEKGRYYYVRAVKEGDDKNRSVWSCECPSFINRDIEECKHIKRVKELLKLEEEVKKTGMEYDWDWSDTGSIIDERALTKIRRKLGDILVRIRILIEKIERMQEGRTPSCEGVKNG